MVTVSKARKGKRGGGQRETEWEGALLTKLFLHFGRWMGLTEEENRRKECFQECQGDYKGFAFPLPHGGFELSVGCWLSSLFAVEASSKDQCA